MNLIAFMDVIVGDASLGAAETIITYSHEYAVLRQRRNINNISPLRC